MGIRCRFTVRINKVLLDYVGTPQWGLHGDNFTSVKKSSKILVKTSSTI